MISGISIRENQVKRLLTEHGFKGKYLLVSTKSDSAYARKLAVLKTNQELIVDLYTPIFLEKELTLSKWKPQDWLTRFRNKETVKKFLRRGDHFLVANRRQKDYWIDISKNLCIPLKTNNISVFPTGSGSHPSSFALRPSTQHFVVLWFGGIYPWMSPEPLLEAFSLVAQKYPKWKLRFLGGFHPDTGYRNLYQKIELAAKSKISNNQLEFVSWQSEKNLSKYFRDVSFAVHLARPTPEDYYAHRVRLLTLFSAGIPVLTAGMDVVSDLAVRLGSASRTKLDKKSIERGLTCLMNSPEELNRMKKLCSRIEQTFVKQEMDINLLI